VDIISFINNVGKFVMQSWRKPIGNIITRERETVREMPSDRIEISTLLTLSTAAIN
jgi:hypothetical protein